jgi:hypothetical protein
VQLDQNHNASSTYNNNNTDCSYKSWSLHAGFSSCYWSIPHSIYALHARESSAAGFNLQQFFSRIWTTVVAELEAGLFHCARAAKYLLQLLRCYIVPGFNFAIKALLFYFISLPFVKGNPKEKPKLNRLNFALGFLLGARKLLEVPISSQKNIQGFIKLLQHFWVVYGQDLVKSSCGWSPNLLHLFFLWMIATLASS